MALGVYLAEFDATCCFDVLGKEVKFDFVGNIGVGLELEIGKKNTIGFTKVIGWKISLEMEDK